MSKNHRDWKRHVQQQEPVANESAEPVGPGGDRIPEQVQQADPQEQGEVVE